MNRQHSAEQDKHEPMLSEMVLSLLFPSDKRIGKRSVLMHFSKLLFQAYTAAGLVVWCRRAVVLELGVLRGYGVVLFPSSARGLL